METTLLVVVAILFILAITDLIVGVSNDAVNFLNSAIGSKVASRRVIMAVAAAGIFIGATFSSGMMEVARSGIFNPAFFRFEDIMMIFLAVMIADVILLDVFNTLGLPTSTTVSIVFELLGAAVIMALVKTLQSGAPIEEVALYINSSKAITIITGILLSVFIAFTAGAILQYFSRLLFSFQYKKRMKYVGAVWSGLAMTAITHFLLLKGFKGASFVTAEFLEWVKVNQTIILLVSFLVWTLIFQIAVSAFKSNILRFVVLFGTFALAMAFAGNDLVNFIGVPMAGFESFKAWQSAGMDSSMSMEILSGKVRTDTLYLLLAGIIMASTLYLSRKARRVTDTQVNLSRQEEGDERFSPNLIARLMVKGAGQVGKVTQLLIPARWIVKAESNFSQSQQETQDDDVAFDLVRAAVNLTVASALIALGTSFKLPLSTTYVSFMVAMGTSLSDRAWGRESAVYRVAGVLNVIGGWFVTALVAFLMSGLFVFIIQALGFNGGFLLFGLAAVLVVRSFLRFRKKEKRDAVLKQTAVLDLNDAVNQERFVGDVIKALKHSGTAYHQALDCLIKEDSNLLKEAYSRIQQLRQEYRKAEQDLFAGIRKTPKSNLAKSSGYLRLLGKMQDILQSSEDTLQFCRQHVMNNHKPPSKKQAEYLNKMIGLIQSMVDGLVRRENISNAATELESELENLLQFQFEAIHTKKLGKKNSLLIFRIVSETRDLRSSMIEMAAILRDLTAPKQAES